MIKNTIYYGIAMFCTLTANTIFSPPKKELMKKTNTFTHQTSGKVLAIVSASAGCCLGTTAQTLGYNCGPCTGAALGLSCSVTLLPVALRAIEHCISKQKSD